MGDRDGMVPSVAALEGAWLHHNQPPPKKINSNEGMSIRGGESDEKRQRAEVIQPKASDGQDYAVNEMGEGDRILGLTTEYSGWDVYNNEARKVDRELVKDWTASLNFLLLFAAIFAAVLTAFIIESKKMLEQDGISVMVEVMILYTNSVANGTHQAYQPPQFEPTHTAVAINFLFFASLSASLLAALASVIALQWVADYDAAITRGGSSPEDRAKRRQFRHAGVVWWKMNEIIAALPLLLYFSVVLFFAGLILWMLEVNHVVGVVIAGFAAIAVIFYGVTTFLAVVTVSAPFRTPLSRWIYSLSRLPFSAVFIFAQAMNIHNIHPWLKNQHIIYTASHKRMDLAVENRGQFGRDALVWLANQLSISQDSYRRLLLLVSEFPILKPEHLPTFDPTEASWDSIFDLLGWKSLTADQKDAVSPEERYGMAILKRCYTIPGIRQLVTPTQHPKYIFDTEDLNYWSQFCEVAKGGPWNPKANPAVPNCLFLLLRDTPDPVDFSPLEMEVIVRAARWRNSELKQARGWDVVFASPKPLSSAFFSSTVAFFNRIHRLRNWWAWEDNDKQLYTRTASRVVQVATIRQDLTGDVSASLMGAYYGEALRQDPSEEPIVAVESILLLLSRELNYCPATEKGARVRELIAMLWLWPLNPVSRKWESFADPYGKMDQWEPAIITDWINRADEIPYITEILQILATTQAGYPDVGPLWRAMDQGENRDPHLVEALLTFDRMMGSDCTESDHLTMVNLVCQDLELEQAPELDDFYFTESRVYSLSQLNDHCLRALAYCARDVDIPTSMFLPEGYINQRPSSLARVADHVFRKTPTPAAVPLQASFWLTLPRQTDLYSEAPRKLDVFSHLQLIFRYPITCSTCHDGPGHLVFHIFSVLYWRGYPNDLTLFATVPLEGRGMEVNCIIFCMIYSDEPISLAEYFDAHDDQCVALLKGMIDDIKTSRLHLLVWTWNVSRAFEDRSVYSEDLAALLIGVQVAMQRPPEPACVFVLASLSQIILRLRDKMLFSAARTLVEREAVADEANRTSQLLLSSLAALLIFGRRNSQSISCAQATTNVCPALGWLPPYIM